MKRIEIRSNLALFLDSVPFEGDNANTTAGVPICRPICGADGAVAIYRTGRSMQRGKCSCLESR